MLRFYDLFGKYLFIFVSKSQYNGIMTQQEIGNAVKERRKRLGINQQTLADLASVAVNMVVAIEAPSNTSLMPFEEMWEQYIMPLSGKTISNGDLTNTVLNVDWNGIQRLTSKGNVGKISIEDFKYAYNQPTC